GIAQRAGLALGCCQSNTSADQDRSRQDRVRLEQAVSEDIFADVRTPTATLASTDETTIPKVRAFLTASKLQADVRFNPADVDSALIDQASIFAEYGQYQALAILQRDQLETRLELLQARLDVGYREKLEKEGKKITEKVIEARIKTNPLYLKTRAALSE